MPTIAEFRGIKVCIYWQDHMPPHFHAFYGDEEVLVAIESLEILQGHFPAKQRKYLLQWSKCHQKELQENWKNAQNGKMPSSIATLDN